LVEVNIDSAFPKEIDILGSSGDVVKVGIEYPWLPIKCRKCMSFGHASHTCIKVEKSAWIPRRKEPVQQVNEQKNVSVLNEKVSEGVKSGPSKVGQWTTVSRPKRTPISRPIIADNSQHWTNSFQLLAKVDGIKYDDREVRKSNEAFQKLMDEMEDPAPSLDKGKGQLVEKEGDGMRGFSPHS